MAYKHLDYLKRCKIQAFWRAGYTEQQIADEIGVHKSTISREFSRNMTWINARLGYWTYKADYAQYKADERKRIKPKCIKFTDRIKEFVIEKIKEDWSPEQICGFAKRHTMFNLSHEWIYRFILEDRKQGGDLYKHLRHQHKKYRKRYGSPKRQGAIRNRRFIDERPSVVDEKSRIGDWEIDTIIGKNHKQAIVSIVERKSKFTILKKVKRKTAKNVAAVTIDALAKYVNNVHTVTADNGSEFASHEDISSELVADFFFAHPYSSWERGLNENTNGLVRQYIKKGSDIHHIDDVSLRVISDKLNARPRKGINFQTPIDVFQNQKI